jgi:hypothetical protein
VVCARLPHYSVDGDPSNWCVARSVGSVGHWPTRGSTLLSGGMRRRPDPYTRAREGIVAGAGWFECDWRAVGGGRWVAGEVDK